MISRKTTLVALLALCALSLAPSAFAAPIPVTNSDFTSGTFTGWTTAGTTSISNISGDNYAFTRYYPGSYIEQNLGVSIDESKTYTLSTKQIDPAGWGGSYILNLIARGGGPDQILARTYVRTGANTSTLANLQASGSELAGAAGKSLVVRLASGSTGYQNGGFDNVAVADAAGPGTLGAPTVIDIINPSFELPGGLGASNWDTNATGWQNTYFRVSGPGNYLAGIGGAQDGNNAMAAGFLYQTLATTFEEGAVYTLSGYMWPRFGTGQLASAYLYRGNQTFIQSGMISDFLDGTQIIGDNSQWIPFSFSYTATAADAGQQIGIMLDGSFIDNVQLTVQQAQAEAVPEPSTYALGLIGLVGLAFVVRRNKRKSAC